MKDRLLVMRQEAINGQVQAAQNFGFQNGRLVAIEELLAALSAKEPEADEQAEEEN